MNTTMYDPLSFPPGFFTVVTMEFNVITYYIVCNKLGIFSNRYIHTMKMIHTQGCLTHSLLLHICFLPHKLTFHITLFTTWYLYLIRVYNNYTSPSLPFLALTVVMNQKPEDHLTSIYKLLNQMTHFILACAISSCLYLFS